MQCKDVIITSGSLSNYSAILHLFCLFLTDVRKGEQRSYQPLDRHTLEGMFPKLMTFLSCICAFVNMLLNLTILTYRTDGIYTQKSTRNGPNFACHLIEPI